jgi:hypothetical protein
MLRIDSMALTTSRLAVSWAAVQKRSPSLKKGHRHRPDSMKDGRQHSMFILPLLLFEIKLIFLVQRHLHSATIHTGGFMVGRDHLLNKTLYVYVYPKIWLHSQFKNSQSIQRFSETLQRAHTC